MAETNDYDLPNVPAGPFQDVITRAQHRFKRAQTWESVARQRWMRDYKFANGDEENNYQWDDDIYQQRDNEQRPTLTINKVRQHNLLITNDAKQNKQGIKYRPVGDDATRDAADVLEGIARHIQNISHAQDAHGMAIDFQVEAGLGFTRVVTGYVSDDSFDQEIYIRAVADPMSCYLDPGATEMDGSDAKWGLIFVDRAREDAEVEYPWLEHIAPPSNIVDGDDAGWIRDDYVRECEYYEIEEEEDELLGDPTDGTTILKSVAPASLVKQWEAELEEKGEKIRRRKIQRKHIHWYKIVGDRVVNDAPWAGTTIPIIPWLGQVTVVDQQMDRKGHTRYLKSPQRMLNYNRSAAVEYGALQTKAPWIAGVSAIEGYETYWNSANVVNHSVLPYNDVGEDGNPIQPPQRPAPPQSAPVFMEGAQAADNDMMLASGQYQAELGAPGNEKSGRAISERQRQGDRATYHFTDNQAIAIRREGSILLELIPKIYDTERVIRILGENGEEAHVKIDPNADQAAQVGPQQAPDQTQKIAAIFNPNVGMYEVVSDVGPDYATQRQEAFDAIVQIITQAPELLGKIGDLLFKVADFPLADEIAERLKPGLDPQAQAAIQQLQDQLSKGNQQLGQAMQALSEERLKNAAKDTKSNIDAFRADTERLSVAKDILKDNVAPFMPELMIHLQPFLAKMVTEALQEAMQDNLGPIKGITIDNLVQNARQGPPQPAGQLPLGTPGTGDQSVTPSAASPQMPQQQIRRGPPQIGGQPQGQGSQPPPRAPQQAGRPLQ